MNDRELLKRVGSISQIGGVKSYTFNDGAAKGVRAVEVDTGVLRFIIVVDRCMDIAQAYYKGEAISWISKTGITALEYYEKDGLNWLRGFYGGLVTTCGLKNIGKPFADRGLHDRISHIPAQNISIFSGWIENEYIMKISGEMRQSIVFGENLVLKRTITAKLFDHTFTIEDTVINEGFQDEQLALCYHCNFGYPLVREGGRIVNVPSEVSDITGPIHGKQEECIPVDYSEEEVTVGIENEKTGVYITYRRDTLPDFLIWKMLGESEYVIGLEPRTTALQGQEIADNNKFILLKSFEEYKTKLSFSAVSLY